MAAGKHDILIEQGATFSMVITWRDSDAALVDLSGYTARMQVRQNKSSSTALLDIDTDSEIVLGGAAGTITITVPASVTAALDFNHGVYDLEVESSGGVVTRLLEGAVEFSKEVTR